MVVLFQDCVGNGYAFDRRTLRYFLAFLVVILAFQHSGVHFTLIDAIVGAFTRFAEQPVLLPVVEGSLFGSFTLSVEGHGLLHRRLRGGVEGCV